MRAEWYVWHKSESFLDPQALSRICRVFWILAEIGELFDLFSLKILLMRSIRGLCGSFSKFKLALRVLHQNFEGKINNSRTVAINIFVFNYRGVRLDTLYLQYWVIHVNIFVFNRDSNDNWLWLSHNNRRVSRSHFYNVSTISLGINYAGALTTEPQTCISLTYIIPFLS